MRTAPFGGRRLGRASASAARTRPLGPVAPPALRPPNGAGDGESRKGPRNARSFGPIARGLCPPPQKPHLLASTGRSPARPRTRGNHGKPGRPPRHCVRAPLDRCPTRHTDRTPMAPAAPLCISAGARVVQVPAGASAAHPSSKRVAVLRQQLLHFLGCLAHGLISFRSCAWADWRGRVERQLVQGRW